MPSSIRLSLEDVLPLTCSRSGTCCHGKVVHLNPWELAKLAQAKTLTAREFRDRYCEFGGVRLRFDGKSGWKNLKACSLYQSELGCSVHSGRPLVCRLFPLGRQRQGELLYYIHQGDDFPCLEGCPEVVDLPQLSVADYINGQATKLGELAQDEYLEMMKSLADGGFAYLLESGLVESGDSTTLSLWREMGCESSEQLAGRLGSEWIDVLMLPELSDHLNDPTVFLNQHYALIQSKLELTFGEITDMTDFSKASGLMMGLALYLGTGLGANPVTLVEHWIQTAIDHGASKDRPEI